MVQIKACTRGQARLALQSVTASRGNDIPVHRVINIRATDVPTLTRLRTGSLRRSKLSDPRCTSGILTQTLQPDLRGLGQNTITIPTDGFTDMSNNVWAGGDRCSLVRWTGCCCHVVNWSRLELMLRPVGADRLVRQAGLSNSDSHFNISIDWTIRALGQTVDDLPNGGPGHGETFPLLWTEDNEIPLQFEKTITDRVAGSTDEHRAFFRDRQTIFGEPDNPFVTALGTIIF